MDFDRSYFGYADDQLQSRPLWLLRDIARYIAYAGLFLHLLKIQLPKNPMIITMCIVNFLLLLPSLYMPFRRYGPDFTAYLNQAG
jgi:hypothetical protein